MYAVRVKSHKHTLNESMLTSIAGSSNAHAVTLKKAASVPDNDRPKELLALGWAINTPATYKLATRYSQYTPSIGKWRFVLIRCLQF